jgi:ribosomal protein S18 acetylase RimI-like enzyme
MSANILPRLTSLKGLTQEITPKADPFGVRQLLTVKTPQGEAIGSIDVLVKRNTNNAEICGIVTEPTHQGRGFATLLLEQTIARLRAIGVPKVTLQDASAHFSNGKATGVYRKIGFKPVREGSDSLFLNLKTPAK